jgi:purine nucleosidase
VIKQRLIIDTDVGIDDAIALLMILAQPEVEVEAVTTVFGNVPLAQVIHNAAFILEMVKTTTVPLYQGGGKPLLQAEPLHALEVHGDDGLGGMSSPEIKLSIEPEPASLALTRLVRQNPGQITLLTLGPLTNIALAIRLDPAFIKAVKQIVIMGGAVDGRGNTSPPAEFNIAADPEAARIVFDACARNGLLPQLITWETTLSHPVSSADWQMIIEGESPAARFVQGMTGHIRRRQAAGQDQSFLWPDPLAAAVAISPHIVRRYECRYIEVETGQNLARGQTIADYRTRSTNRPNVQIVRELDAEKFKALLRSAVK